MRVYVPLHHHTSRHSTEYVTSLFLVNILHSRLSFSGLTQIHLSRPLQAHSDPSHSFPCVPAPPSPAPSIATPTSRLLSASRPVCSRIRICWPTLSTHATAAEDVTATNGSVHAILGSVKIPFPLSNANGCSPDGGHLNCPLQAGTEYVYSSDLTIPSYTPPVCDPFIIASCASCGSGRFSDCRVGANGPERAGLPIVETYSMSFVNA